MGPMRNRDTTGVWIGTLIAFLGLVAMAMPGLSGMDMMRMGFGLMFVGFFVLIIGLITAVVFGQRARLMNRILAEENILARWTYDATQSRQQIQEEYARLTTYNRSTFMIVFAWFVVIGGIMVGVNLFNSGEVNWFFAFLFFGILGLLSLVAFITPILWRRQALSSSREVIIAHSGVVLNGALHTWAPPLNRLESVLFNNASGEKTLEFKIRYLSRASIIKYPTYIVSVPVPAGKEIDAQKIADHFQGMK
jgi:hypothetical protein